jgi:predicted Rossmann fold flavoprotein
MCAAVAGQRGRRVLLIDHAERPGKKILISGGGRCNFTNVNAVPERYLSANRHFAVSALRRYTAQDFIDMVDRHRIAWHEKTLGQLFCDGSARQIVGMLMDECARGAVRIALGERITGVTHADGRFRVTWGGRTASAPALVIATGGPSIPKMGATGFAYDLARQFGLGIVEPLPALVPLTLGEEEALLRSLSGVATEVIARAGKASFREAALLTHKGLSGPAILQISSYWRPGEPIGRLPARSAAGLAGPAARAAAHPLHKLLAEALPQRLAEALAKRIGLSDLAAVPDRRPDEVARLSRTALYPNSPEGFAGRGHDRRHRHRRPSSQTMAARNAPALRDRVKAADVTGWPGGYNSSGPGRAPAAAGGVSPFFPPCPRSGWGGGPPEGWWRGHAPICPSTAFRGP